MILHAKKCICHPLLPQCWRGLWPVMQLHEKRHMKWAGVAGIALRAEAIAMILLNPQLVKKHQSTLSYELEHKITRMFALGMSYKGIS
ncbi:Uncharacterised protein [Serratia quinivorans]|nr:Uncharacterised protein [Serratia quinivorans]CAI2158023.1 Uncharacterised protein [Serratia quinivorans]